MIMDSYPSMRRAAEVELELCVGEEEADRSSQFLFVIPPISTGTTVTQRRLLRVHMYGAGMLVASALG